MGKEERLGVLGRYINLWVEGAWRWIDRILIRWTAHADKRERWEKGKREGGK